MGVGGHLKRPWYLAMHGKEVYGTVNGSVWPFEKANTSRCERGYMAL